MATKINFANKELQRLEMLRIMVLNQLEFLDQAIDTLSAETPCETEEEFNFLSDQLLNFQQQLNVATVM